MKTMRVFLVTLAVLFVFAGCLNSNNNSSNPVLVSLGVTTLPTKTTYIVGEEFDSSGIVVTGTYNNGNTADVTDKVTYAGFDSSAPGEITITVSIDKNSVTPASFTVTVSASSVITGLTVKNGAADVDTTLAIYEGGGISLTAILAPAGVTGTVTWVSDNAAVTVSPANGLTSTITGVTAGGTATITVSADNDETDDPQVKTFTVTVNTPSEGPVTDLTITAGGTPVGTTIALDMNEEKLLTGTLAPAGVLGTITWASDNAAVTVSSATGLTSTIKGITPGGSATITVSASNADNGGTPVTKTLTVTVNPLAPVTGLTIQDSGTEVTSGFALDVNEQKPLTATLAPAAVSGATVNWVSNNAAVTVTPAADGLSATIKGITAAGSADITVSAFNADNGGTPVTKTFTVTVKNPVTDLTVKDGAAAITTLILPQPGTKLLTTELAPTGITGTVTWVSDTPAAVTVTSPGSSSTITGITAGGTADITVSASNADNTAPVVKTITVKVLSSSDFAASTTYDADTDVVAARLYTVSVLGTYTKAQLTAAEAFITPALAAYNALSADVKALFAADGTKFTALAAKIEALIPTTAKMIQREVGGGGEYGEYYSVRLDLYPYIQTLTAGTDYAITPTGNITVAMNNFAISIRPGAWGEDIFIGARASGYHGAASSEGIGALSHTRYISVGTTVNIQPGDYFIEIANYADRVGATAQGAVATTITNFDLTITGVPGISVELKKVDSSGGDYEGWRENVDLYPNVSGALSKGKTYTLTITGHTDVQLEHFTFNINTNGWTSCNNFWSWLSYPTESAGSTNIAAGDFTFTKDFAMDTAINITDYGQGNILLYNISHTDALTDGQTGATLSNLTFTIIEKPLANVSMLKADVTGGSYESWRGRIDLYPASQDGLDLGKTYTLTITGDSDTAMNNVGFMIENTGWYPNYANSAEFSGTDTIPAGAFTFTKEFTMQTAIGSGSLANFGAYYLMLINAVTGSTGSNGDTAATLSNLNVTITENP
jgi:hypothetical protein